MYLDDLEAMDAVDRIPQNRNQKEEIVNIVEYDETSEPNSDLNLSEIAFNDSFNGKP